MNIDTDTSLAHELRTAQILIVSDDKKVDGKIIYMTFKALWGIVHFNGHAEYYHHLGYLIHNTLGWYFLQKHINADKFEIVIDYDFAIRSFNREEELDEFIKNTKVSYDKLEYGKQTIEYRSFIHEQPF
jgi:hypothetical protein